MRIQVIFSKSGVALVTVMIFMFILLISGATFLRLATFENISSNESIQSAQSFYLAEAGVQRAIAYLKDDNEHSVGTLPIDPSFGGGSCSISVTDDLTRSVKIITATANFRGNQKTITTEVQLLPSFFKNTFTSGGDLEFFGVFAAAYAHGITWLGGEYKNALEDKWWSGSMGFDTLAEGLAPDQTTLRFPDMNGNSIVNEFTDFVLYFQNEIQKYDPSEVLWIQTEGTVNIWPKRDYADKKIIFVEGSSPGHGDVNVFLGATSWWGEQDVTIASTGEIRYIEPLENPTTSRLSLISWGGYTETDIFYASHRSVISTQTVADFKYLLSIASVVGSIFANEKVDIQEVIVGIDFYHDDSLNEGDIPPGLRPLCTNNYFLGDIVSWSEG